MYLRRRSFLRAPATTAELLPSHERFVSETSRAPSLICFDDQRLILFQASFTAQRQHPVQLSTRTRHLLLMAPDQ